MAIKRPFPLLPSPLAGRYSGSLQPESFAWIALILMLLFTCAAWFIADRIVSHRVSDRFLYRAEKERDFIVRRMQAYELVLQGTAAFVESSRDVSRDEWRRYVTLLELEKNLPGLQAVGLAWHLTADQRAGFVQAARREGLAQFDVWPPGEREEYASILYLEPLDGINRQALGYDMFSEAVRRDALERARDTGRAAVSGKVTLVQEKAGTERAGFLMYLPVYRENAPRETIAERRQALQGFVHSAFRAEDLMRNVLGNQLKDVDLLLYDEEEKPDKLLFDSGMADNPSQRGAYAVRLSI
ncbi:MAG TPA: CHASE domain-containing protein, partial [Azonexus sp.]